MAAPLGTLNSNFSLLEPSYTGMNHQLIRCEVLPLKKRDLGKGSMPRSHRRVAFSKRPACRGWRCAPMARDSRREAFTWLGRFSSPLAAANDGTDINQQMLTRS